MTRYVTGPGSLKVKCRVTSGETFLSCIVAHTVVSSQSDMQIESDES